MEEDHLPPLGPPYDRMSDAAKDYWAKFAALMPYMRSSDRCQLRMICELFVERDRRGDAFDLQKQEMLDQMLDSFGGRRVAMAFGQTEN